MQCKGLKMLSHITLVSSIGLTLSACLDVATTGAQAVYNRRSIEKNINEHYLTMKIYKALYFKTDEFKHAHIAIATYNGDVLLAGQVQAVWQKQKAVKIVKAMSSVNDVYDFLTVQNPSSHLTRLSDSWITSKVKAKLLVSEDVDATLIKVVTENGTVYLMGVVPYAEADAAAEIASETEGVQSVVKIFSYVTIQKKLAAKVNHRLNR